MSNNDTAAAGLIVGMMLPLILSGVAFWTTVVFFVLSLMDKIDWSYWWVFSPIWLVALAVPVFGVLGAVIGRLLR